MSKPRPNRLGMYADIQPILDAALSAGGGSYTLPTHGAAVHWRQRAYKFRKLYAETYAQVSKYDRLSLPRVEETSSTVNIVVRVGTGTFTPLDEASSAGIFSPNEDALLDAAAEFAKKLGGE